MIEEEIRPQDIFDEYLKLCEQDVIDYFGQATYRMVACPACNNRGQFAFHKKGFNYDECKKCHTLFVNPRPDKESFERYYQDAPSTKYWATTFYKKTEAARREKMWVPKAGLIQEILKQNSSPELLVDIGAGYGIFADVTRELYETRLLLVEPSNHLSEICREKGFEVLQKTLEELTKEDVPSCYKCFVCFELFEHLHDPGYFLERLNTIMQSGDIFVFTTLSGTGIDIQVLWEEAKAVSPPHHLNFFNPWSVKKLVEAHGFSDVKVQTPGKLDINILESSLDKFEDRFLKTFLHFANENCKAKFQELLSSHCFSSHMMVSCKKE